MKKIFFILLLTGNLGAAAQESLGNFYVALKGGLSIREKPEVSAGVIGKIPYGTRISVLQPPNEIKSIVTEGIEGQWKLVNYGGKKGYIINSYLFPWPPPTAAVKDMRQYFSQVAAPVGSKLIVKKGDLNKNSVGSWQMNKQLYKNGAEWQEFIGYEYHSDIYLLPDFTIAQGFLLLRMLPEFSLVFGEKEEYPQTSRKYNKGDLEYEVVVEKDETAGSLPWYRRIKIEFAEGPYHLFEMYYLDNQLVVFFNSAL